MKAGNPKPIPMLTPPVCPSRGRGHQNCGEYRSASYRPATSPSSNPAKLRQVHSFAFSLP
jgi:hypothetical protein